MNQQLQITQARPSFADEFLRGQRDCQEGLPHQTGESDAYNRGYATEYEAEQIRTHRSVNHGIK